MVVTGAAGYIGSAVVRAALKRGARVRALARGPQSHSDARVIPFVYDLEADPPQAFEGAEAVIHLAFDNAAAAAAIGSDVNASATLRLRDAARRAGVPRFIFVSSQSALGTARSAYARSKAATEATLTGPGEVVVRPGMVYGGESRGLYGQFCALVQKATVLPVPRGSTTLQVIHVDDLADALLEIAFERSLSRSQYNLAAARPITFAAFLRGLAEYRFGRKLAVVSVPLGPLPALLRMSAGLHPNLRALSERISGLEALSPMEVDASLATLALPLRDFEASLSGDSERWGR